MASDKKIKGKRSGAAAPIGSPLNIAVFENRVVIEGEIFNAVESEVVGADGEAQPSSLPHLTHEKDQRAAHFTSSRVVAISENYVIHERFHQDADGRSQATHDRFFAVDEQGVVHSATAAWREGVHLARYDEKPMRGSKLNSAVNAKLSFNVGKKDEKHPPLSPRSMRRTVDDKGYSAPRKK